MCSTCGAHVVRTAVQAASFLKAGYIELLLGGKSVRSAAQRLSRKKGAESPFVQSAASIVRTLQQANIGVFCGSFADKVIVYKINQITGRKLREVRAPTALVTYRQVDVNANRMAI
jgi:hypothetical protein